jgi:hypothetical protein
VEIKEQCALLRWQIELRHAAVSKVILSVEKTDDVNLQWRFNSEFLDRP